jgi:hypothetical protein
VSHIIATDSIQPERRPRWPLRLSLVLPNGFRVEVANGTACPVCNNDLRLVDVELLDDPAFRIICGRGHVLLNYQRA